MIHDHQGITTKGYFTPHLIKYRGEKHYLLAIFSTQIDAMYYTNLNIDNEINNTVIEIVNLAQQDTLLNHTASAKVLHLCWVPLVIHVVINTGLPYRLSLRLLII